MSLHFAVFYGSVRAERQGIKYARFLNAQLSARGHQVSFVDPLEYRLPLLDKMHKEYPPGAAPDPLPKLADILRSADGFMIVSGEYNHSIPPALKNLLDHFLEEWFWRPSAIACYSAGVRRRSGSDAAARNPRRARHAKHPFHSSDAESAGSVRSRRNATRSGARASGWPLPRRIRMVRRSAQAGAGRGRAILSARPGLSSVCFRCVQRLGHVRGAGAAGMLPCGPSLVR
jgi:NAD(P)H-dependent FMN reductase